MANLGQQIQSRILGPSGTDVLSQGLKDLYHTLFRAEEDKPKAPFGGVPSLSRMPRTQERSALDIGRSYWAGLSQEEKLMEFVDLLAPGPAKLGAGVKAVLGAAKGVPLVGAILRKDALKGVGRQFRNMLSNRRKSIQNVVSLNRKLGKTGDPETFLAQPGPSKRAVKELIQGIRKAPQKELDFVDEITLGMQPERFGSFSTPGKIINLFKETAEATPSRVELSVHPALPSGEGINTVFHELGHARIAGTPGLKKLLGGQEEGVVRRFGEAITPFAEQAVKEGRELNPKVPKLMLRKVIGLSASEDALQRVKAAGGPSDIAERLVTRIEEARRTLRGQLPGEMRMFLEEASEVTGESIAKKIGGIRYEGVMEGLPEAGIPNVYQFTALKGPSKGGTFSAGSLDLEDVKKALGKQEETWRRVEGGGGETRFKAVEIKEPPKPRKLKESGLKRVFAETKHEDIKELIQEMEQTLPPSLKKFVQTEDDVFPISNFREMKLAKKGAAPPTERAMYRPAVQMKDGTVLWHPKAQIHSDAITMNTEKVRSGGYSFDTVVSTGGVGPDGNYYSSKFPGDVFPETFGKAKGKLVDFLKEFAD